MSATGTFGELERVVQAIALGEGFQLLVIECEGFRPGVLHRLLDEVQRQAAGLRGVPPLILTYDPYLTEDWVEDVLAAIVVLPPGTEAGASIVAVIDGTEAQLGRVRGERDDGSRWFFLFQRLNERRNAIARNLAGTLVLALPPTLTRMFLEAAPDMASIRSGVFRLNAQALGEVVESPVALSSMRAWYPPSIVREAALRRMAADPLLSSEARRVAVRELQGDRMPHPTWSDASHLPLRISELHELFIGMFSTDELWRFVHFNYPELESEIERSSMSLSELVGEVVVGLKRHERIGPSLFERLALEYPGRSGDIAEVARLWGHELFRGSRGGTRVSAPSDLHEALLGLAPAQVEQVTYLAGFAGSDVSPTVMRGLRERSSISAREIFERARAGGPEGLARLAEAIEIVTGQ